MYTRSAKYYDTLYGTKDYAGAAAALQQIIETHRPGAGTLLDVACGTGRHLQYFLRSYKSEGLDINDDLLKLAAARCPDVTFHHQDMLLLELERRFDVVTCLFGAIAALVTPDKLSAAVGRMASHLDPGGLLLIEPFFTPDQYWKDKLTANYSVSETQNVAWMYISSQQGSVAAVNIHYLASEGQTIEYFTERHEVALYQCEDYSEAFRRADLAWTFEEPGPLFRCGLYIARKRVTGVWL